MQCSPSLLVELRIPVQVLLVIININFTVVAAVAAYVNG